MTKGRPGLRRFCVATSMIVGGGILRGIVVGLLIAAAILPCMISPLRGADGYPAKPITLVVAYPPGGILDVVARIAADGLRTRFNQPVIVVNRTGGGGSIGIGEVVRARPDGYTLLVGNDGTQAILPFVDPSFAYDPVRDFVPIAMPIEYGHALLVNAGVPANSISAFVTFAKSQPDRLTFGTPGYGSLAHAAMELFMKETGTRMLHVPYKGAAPALTDLMAGVITSNLQSMTGVIPQIGNRQVKILAVTSERRVTALPDVPTMAESGLPRVVVTSWVGVLGPAGLPADIRDKLSNAMVDTFKQPDVRARLHGLGVESIGSDAKAFADFYAAEIAKWKQIVADRGIRIAQ
jgi:tripartite-type tricarboxylate transporter receptor subunit TctC